MTQGNDFKNIKWDYAIREKLESIGFEYKDMGVKKPNGEYVTERDNVFNL